MISLCLPSFNEVNLSSAEEELTVNVPEYQTNLGFLCQFFNNYRLPDSIISTLNCAKGEACVGG